MKILNTFEFSQHLNEMAYTDRAITVIHDFFEALAKLKKGTFAYVYYGYDYTPYLPKYLKAEDGTKQLNPMLGRLYKLSSYRFQAGLDYYEELEKIFPGYKYSPDAPINQENRPKRPWKPLPPDGYPCQQNTKNGEIALPIINSKTTWTQWVMVDEDGKYVPVDYETIKPYIGPSKPKPPVSYKMLYVPRIYMLNGARNTCPIDVFAYPFLSPFFKKQIPHETY